MISPNSADKTAVLTSWKEIANYLGKGVRTVQRWEQDFGLPVRRPLGSNKKAILARPRDLDAWVALRCSSRAVCSVDQGLLHRPIAMLTSLNIGIETSRQLRHSNQALLYEVKSALDQLRTQLDAIQIG